MWNLKKKNSQAQKQRVEKWLPGAAVSKRIQTFSYKNNKV